jgi:hypothetical protein
MEQWIRAPFIENEGPPKVGFDRSEEESKELVPIVRPGHLSRQLWPPRFFPRDQDVRRVIRRE